MFSSKQNRTEQDIYQTLMNANLDYKNFLKLKYPGLQPTDNLFSLMTTLASNMPNSTIAVKAANENAILNISDSILHHLLHFYSQHYENQVIDMKNGFIYYMSDQVGKGLNFDDVNIMCASQNAGFKIVFYSDQHIQDFLNLYKMSKFIGNLRKNFPLSFCIKIDCKFYITFIQKYMTNNFNTSSDHKKS